MLNLQTLVAIIYPSKNKYKLETVTEEGSVLRWETHKEKFLEKKSSDEALHTSISYHSKNFHAHEWHIP